jgi:hypothetical protein
MQYIYNRILKSSTNEKVFYPPPTAAFALAALAIFCSSTIHAQMQATLNASNFNGYNIACFGQQNGTLSVSVTGGTHHHTVMNGAMATALPHSTIWQQAIILFV